jgi:AraC-like DNA-binding protein/mannose-6-phosphate isomerase-like protein (cupin superfamily)
MSGLIKADEYRFHSNIDKESHDLTVYHYGIEECSPGHSFGPALRDHFLIHYIISGRGIFQVNDKSYNLEKNQGFLICPGIITYYEADNSEPWVYTWVGFQGLKAEAYLKSADLDQNNPVFTCGSPVIEKCFQDMLNSGKYKHASDLRLQGILGILLSELIENLGVNIIPKDNYKDIYIKRAIQFIETNYSRNITVSDMAKHIGLNQNYFSTLFKKILGIPPQEYIMKYRINKACELLKNDNLSVSDISRSVGYNDPLGFSKIFKQIKGMSPKAFREDSGSLQRQYSE